MVGKKKIKRNGKFFTPKKKIVALIGLGTFFFGFGAGALLNLYLLAANNPLVTQLRSTLTYKSAILGDGILLPLLTMQMTAFLLSHKRYWREKLGVLGILGGGLITAYFHIKQALDGVINWTMPTPWHWNLLGLGHALYMFAVSFLISVFLLVCTKVIQKEKRIPIEFLVVTIGILLFLVILRLDYIDIKIF